MKFIDYLSTITIVFNLNESKSTYEISTNITKADTDKINNVINFIKLINDKYPRKLQIANTIKNNQCMRLVHDLDTFNEVKELDREKFIKNLNVDMFVTCEPNKSEFGNGYVYIFRHKDKNDRKDIYLKFQFLDKSKTKKYSSILPINNIIHIDDLKVIVRVISCHPNRSIFQIKKKYQK